MLKIIPRQRDGYRTLVHGDDVFHKALRAVIHGGEIWFIEPSTRLHIVELEETTVNYFYALYILSLCESFMASGQCNGWDVVNSFNKGKFHRAYKFQVGL